jgi:hypothetical protein
MITWADQAKTSAVGQVFKLAPGCVDGSGACLFDADPAPARQIIFMGDSQALKWSLAMFYWLSKLPNVTCNFTGWEVHQKGGYYNVSETVFGKQDCGACDSWRAVCQGPRRRVELEFLRMEFLIDSELTTPMRIHWDHNCAKDRSPPCKYYWNTQLFLFDLYLKARQPPPDHIHIMQSMHDCARRSPSDFRRDMAWFVDLLNTTLAPSTNVYFWEAPSPQSARQPAEYRDVTSQACMQWMNAAVKEAIKPFVERTAAAPNASTRGHAGFYGAFDSYTPTASRLDLNVDGVHMRPDWYDTLASAVIAGTCG